MAAATSNVLGLGLAATPFCNPCAALGMCDWMVKIFIDSPMILRNYGKGSAVIAEPDKERKGNLCSSGAQEETKENKLHRVPLQKPLECKFR